MKRAVIHLPAAVIGFLAGLLAHGLWPAHAPTPKAAEPVAVTFCELARDLERYDGKVVRVRAVLRADVRRPFIYDQSCGTPRSRSLPLIEIYGEDSFVLPSWATHRIMCGNGIQYFESHKKSAEVIITGTFRADGFVPGVPRSARWPAIIAESLFETPTPSARR